MKLEETKTPSLLLDITRVRSNAERMSEIAHRNNVRLRPHIKTHKCIEVARIQTAGHSGAITVSTLAEARAFAKNGFDDITYAVPIERGKFADAIELSNSGVRLNLLTDDAETMKALDSEAGNAGVKFDVFLKIDCGTHRVGVGPHMAEAVEIPRTISAAKHLDFAGILTHAGHSYDVKTREEVLQAARHERDSMVELAERLRSRSIDVPTVSIGSTPTMTAIDHLEGIDEIRPGNYIFFDNFQATLGSCSFEDTALTVLAAVVHRSRNKLVIDAGAIALSKDRGPVGLDPGCGYGRVLSSEGSETGLRVTGLSQEHGEIVSDDAATISRFKVGDRVRVLANHSCLTAAQHSHYNVVENGKTVDRWEIHRGW
jgi:D-serine deaminase-like pyridoxal phosphate-dependent protein